MASPDERDAFSGLGANGRLLRRARVRAKIGDVVEFLELLSRFLIPD